MSRPMLYDYNDGSHPDEARVFFIRDDANHEESGAEDFTVYICKEASWGGRWVLIEDADEHGVCVTDHDGGDHSLPWAALDFIGGNA